MRSSCFWISARSLDFSGSTAKAGEADNTAANTADNPIQRQFVVMSDAPRWRFRKDARVAQDAQPRLRACRPSLLPSVEEERPPGKTKSADSEGPAPA